VAFIGASRRFLKENETDFIKLFLTAMVFLWLVTSEGSDSRSVGILFKRVLISY
jgi:hypothetical protein